MSNGLTFTRHPILEALGSLGCQCEVKCNGTCISARAYNEFCNFLAKEQELEIPLSLVRETAFKHGWNESLEKDPIKWLETQLRQLPVDQ